MPHKFDPAKRDKLDSPERRKLLPPEEVLLRLGLGKNDVMTDIGAGTGYFALPAASIVGPGGKVIAVDISTEMLEELIVRAGERGLKNVETVCSQEYDFAVPPSKADFVLMSQVLHEVEDRVRFARSAREILKSGGKLAVVEWQKRSMSNGPPQGERISIEEALDIIDRAGFRNAGAIDYNRTFYFVTAEK